MTIEEFIEARLAEDEATAHAATQGDWEWQQHNTDEWCLRAGDASVIRAVSYETPCLEVGDADEEHIARHDPARVLRQCAAIRAAVEAIDEFCDDPYPSKVRIVAKALRPIAAIWSDHPDYQEEWAA